MRINPILWEKIQQMSVELGSEIGRPIKESTLIMILLSKAVENTDLQKLVTEIDS